MALNVAIQIYRGTKTNLASLASTGKAGALAFTTDTDELYVDTGSGTGIGPGNAWILVGTNASLSNLASPTAINDTTLTFTGAGGLAAGGSSQNITLSPSGSGDIIINTQGGQGIVLPAGGLVESLDSGSPSIVFGAEKILFNSSIGIRTIDPSYGGAVGSSLTIVQSDGLTAFAIGNSSLPRMAWNGNADGSWTIYDYAGGGWSVGMTQRAGKVGFSGNYSPVYTVDANGDINASGVFRDGGTAGVTQAASAVSTLATKGGIVTGFVTSDERLKRDVTPFVKGLDALRSIKPINFWWDKEKSGIESDHAWVGFSAQNVGKSIPEAASHIHENGMLDFNLAGVVAACVNAIQELEVIVSCSHETGTRGRALRKFPAYHPTLKLFPFHRHERPALVLGPFALFGRIPITLVTAPQTFLLSRNPVRIGHHTRKDHLPKW